MKAKFSEAVCESASQVCDCGSKKFIADLQIAVSAATVRDFSLDLVISNIIHDLVINIIHDLVIFRGKSSDL